MFDTRDPNSILIDHSRPKTDSTKIQHNYKLHVDLIL